MMPIKLPAETCVFNKLNFPPPGGNLGKSNVKAKAAGVTRRRLSTANIAERF